MRLKARGKKEGAERGKIPTERNRWMDVNYEGPHGLLLIRNKRLTLSG